MGWEGGRVGLEVGIRGEKAGATFSQLPGVSLDEGSVRGAVGALSELESREGLFTAWLSHLDLLLRAALT